MPGWYFKPLRPGDTSREPIQSEFFSTEAISNSADALVREGIRNSLDARRNGQGVRVSIRISGPEQAVPVATLAPSSTGPGLTWKRSPTACASPHPGTSPVFSWSSRTSGRLAWRETRPSGTRRIASTTGTYFLVLMGLICWRDPPIPGLSRPGAGGRSRRRSSGG